MSKFPRRCNFEGTESLEEQVRTFSHEAAHYQAAFAQQRIIIQSLEDELEKTASDSKRTIDQLQTALEMAQRSFVSNDAEVCLFIAHQLSYFWTRCYCYITLESGISGVLRVWKNLKI